MKVAVVGAEGFIGSYVMEHLKKLGYWADGYDQFPMEYAQYQMNITWPKETVLHYLDHQYDAIINVAGMLGTHELFNDVARAIKVNVEGQYNVAWTANEFRIPYVTIEQPHIWQNPYETTRGAGVRLARALAEHKGLKLATVEALNAFGPRQAHGAGHPQKIVPTFAKAAWANEPLEVYGEGNQMVNLVHGRDIAKVLVAAIPHARTGRDTPHFYGAAAGGNMTVAKVAKKIIQHVGLGHVVHVPMRAGETDDDMGAYHSDTRIFEQENELEISTRYTDFDLHETVDWYKS